jgi:hypothetical protein
MKINILAAREGKFVLSTPNTFPDIRGISELIDFSSLEAGAFLMN